MRGSISIGKPSYGDGRKKITIQLKCKASGVRFTDIEIDYDKFVEALFGMAETPVDFEVRSLKNVGKVKHSKPMQVPVPKDFGEYKYEVDKTSLKDWLVSTYGNDKESVDITLGSKSCFEEINGILHVNFSLVWFE